MSSNIASKLKLVVVAGARPNLMKISPLIEAINKHNRKHNRRARPIDCRLVYTGQHYDKLMSEVFWNDLGLPRPDYDLKVGPASHAAQTAHIMVAFEKVCLRLKPDIVVVVGDVNSTLACALVAVKLGIKIAHVESGLRSFDKSMPEEINRILTDRISDFLFATEKSAVNNLHKEGVEKSKIYFSGNVMIDTLLRFRKKANESDIRERLGLGNKSKYALLTLHRPSNVDDRGSFKRLAMTLDRLSKFITIIFPVHPRTEKMLRAFGLHNYFSLHGGSVRIQVHKDKVNCINPLSYIDFIKLMSDSAFVLTDSGGIQEETTIMGIPCLTIRENTERPVTIEEGTNVLVGCSPERIIAQAKKILRGKSKASRKRFPRLWDGKAAERIVRVLSRIKP